MRLVTVLFALIASRTGTSCNEVDYLRSIELRTGGCPKCGMTIWGSVSAMICGNPVKGGDKCCVTHRLRNENRNFEDSSLDVFDTLRSLGECYNFNVGQLTTELKVRIYHEGIDQLTLEEIRVLTSGGEKYNCRINATLKAEERICDKQ